MWETDMLAGGMDQLAQSLGKEIGFVMVSISTCLIMKHWISLSVIDSFDHMIDSSQDAPREWNSQLNDIFVPLGIWPKCNITVWVILYHDRAVAFQAVVHPGQNLYGLARVLSMRLLSVPASLL